MEKRILLYCRINSQDTVNLGATKKYIGLLKGFKSLGLIGDVVWLRNSGLYLGNHLLYPFRVNPSMESIRNIIFNFIFFDWLVIRKINFKDFDILFIRYPLCHPAFIYLLRKARKSNPQLLIYMEIPTYPYKKEHTGVFRMIQSKMDSFLIPALKNYVDKTIHYGEFPELFGIPSIGIRNGVDVESFPISNCTPVDGKLRLIAIGNWNYWHALERLILGLAHYNKKEELKLNVELGIVGGGRYVSTYHELMVQNGLENKISFYPPCDGPELDQLFDKYDVAIGSLGAHRKNVVLDSALKHREYCARAIPFVLSTPDPDFPEHLPWVWYCPKDDSSIVIENLIAFFESLQHFEYRTNMRQYAMDHIDWSKKLIPIIAHVTKQ